MMSPPELLRSLRDSTLTKWLGIEFFDSVSHAEKLVSAAGGLTAILCIYLVSRAVLGGDSVFVIVSSMGSTAVMLFAVPHGPLSQPWPLLGGHLLSALIGVTCLKFVPQPFLAAALAVGLAIGAMHYLRCVHPPAGATALAAIIGADYVRPLGYQFVITPVMLNVAIILAVAVTFNAFFPWRRYPVWLIKRDREHAPPAAKPGPYPSIAHEDLVYALSHIDSFVDISEAELLRIYELATGPGGRQRLQPEQILLGHYYSNGATSDHWSVRHIVDESPSVDPGKHRVIYKTVAGAGRGTSGVLTRSEFANWARYEVVRDKQEWKRLVESSPAPASGGQE
jgi:CBS-domain-containing membrane protein